jgi:aryl-alcohol dehydrogenase-like predicted oxidoreductase
MSVHIESIRAKLSRRALLALPWLAAVQKGEAASRLLRRIPRSGEAIPAVGLGTAYVFDTDDRETRAKALAVISALIEGGGAVIDTASTYGDAEAVIGAALAALSARPRVFLATKLEAPDAAELERSLTRLQTGRVDLLQLHNVRDPAQSLAAFREWQSAGKCRYVGITSTFHGDYAAVASVIGREKPDFVQIGYSLEDRLAEKEVLPAAAAEGVAVLTALPLGRGRLLRAVRNHPLPDWAQAFASSWAVFFLKFLLADPRVTAVIPGTANPAHMRENLKALEGPLPDPDTRKRMIAFIESL